eukprot:4230352-Prymnesium_polylepis.1
MASSGLVKGLSVPGTTGTFDALQWEEMRTYMAWTLAEVLSANIFKLSIVGPTNVMPAFAHAYERVTVERAVAGENICDPTKPGAHLGKLRRLREKAIPR